MKATTNFLLAFFASGALAQGSIEVIPLKHRTAEQVIPVLRPLLEPGGALTGQYNTLIVRTSPGNLAQIRAALEAIDAPLRRLMISVRFDRAEEAAASGVRGDARISARGSSVDLRIHDSRSTAGEQVDQRIQVLEGGQAYISSGESRVYADAATGFAVLRRVSGSNVVLEIRAQRENFVRGGAIQGEQAVSTVSGRLGEWFEIGGAAQAASRQGSGILSQQAARSASDRRIWVKVEEMPN